MKSRLTDQYPTLATEQQVLFNVALAHWLTIFARQQEIDLGTMKRINEVQHKVIGQAQAILRADNARFPDDTYAEYLDLALDEIGANIDGLIRTHFPTP